MASRRDQPPDPGLATGVGTPLRARRRRQRRRATQYASATAGSQGRIAAVNTINWPRELMRVRRKLSSASRTGERMVASMPGSWRNPRHGPRLSGRAPAFWRAPVPHRHRARADQPRAATPPAIVSLAVFIPFIPFKKNALPSRHAAANGRPSAVRDISLALRTPRMLARRNSGEDARE